jgi:hypothetical protein
MSNLPIACTLGPAAVRARREDLLRGLVRRAEERIDLPNGYRVRFTPAKDLLSTIASVVDLERQCCRFLRFYLSVDPDDGPVWLEFRDRRERKSSSPACSTCDRHPADSPDGRWLGAQAGRANQRNHEEQGKCATCHEACSHAKKLRQGTD